MLEMLNVLHANFFSQIHTDAGMSKGTGIALEEVPEKCCCEWVAMDFYNLS
jgi:hypothetical protein